MALKTNTIPFEQLHNVVVNTVMSKGFVINREDILRIIAKWYKSFADSEEKSLSLQLPTFKEEEVNLICEYILYFDLLIKILNHDRMPSYEGTSLFDIFSYVSSESFRKKSNPIHLNFQKKIKDSLFFDNDTVISDTRFSPLFITHQIDTSAVNDAIYDSFFLFRVLAQSELISYPIIINLESDLSLFVSKSTHLKNPKLLLTSIASNDVKQNSELHDFLNTVNILPIKTIISYKFPYNSSIDSRIYKSLKDDTKRFELILRKRFYYDEIKEDDVVITPEELNTRSCDITGFLKCFEIIHTDHNANLFNSLKDLKEFWRTSGFNPYRVPFPAKWFTCINSLEGLSFWQDQYRKDFPMVKHATLALVENIIDIVYNLNWIDHIPNLPSCSNIIIPQSKLYSTVTNSLSNYFRERDHSIIDFEDIINSVESEKKPVIILDSLNTIMLTNISHLSDEFKTKILTPDFIHYNCQPFIKYHAINYKYEAMVKGSRKAYDSHTEYVIQVISVEKGNILRDIGAELREYVGRFSEDFKDLDNSDLKFTKDESTSPLTESEVIESMDNKHFDDRNYNTNLIEVVTARQEFLLKPNAKVLIEEKGYILSSQASLLQAGIRFLPIAEISKLIENSKIVDRMASMPESALNWKYQLFLKSNRHTKLYDTLKNIGLSIQESTFNKDYLNERGVEVDGFHLPRGYRDWEIICEYLNISEIEEAWTCHKCHGNITALKNAYSNIIEFLNEGGNYGVNIDETVVRKVADIFETWTLIYEPQEERLKMARSIIQSITNKLELQEVVSIKSSIYEQ